MPADYGATVAGVNALLPHFTISEDSTPSTAQVEGFLAVTQNWVGAAIGTIDEDEQGEEWGTARGLAEIGAASLTEDARHPERARPSTSAYGQTLWEKFTSGLAELRENLGLEDGEPSTPPAAATPDAIGFSFPTALFTRTQGY